LGRVITRSPRFCPLRVASEIIALTPCAPTHYFQDLYNNLSNPFVDTTSMSEFDAHSSSTFQKATINQ